MEGSDASDLRCQADILKKQAKYLLSITYYHFTVKLFACNRLFIEQYYDNEQQRDMDKYMNQIILTDLGPLTTC
jgi:hypothetical protein